MLVRLVQGGGIVKTGNIKEEVVLVAMIEGRRWCGDNDEEPSGGDDNGWSESDEASASQQPDTNFHLASPWEQLTIKRWTKYNGRNLN